MTARAPRGALSILVAAVLWGTTGTAAALAPQVGPLAIGAAATGVGGLLQTATALRQLWLDRARLLAQRRMVLLSGAAVAVFPLAYYSSVRLAGVAVGTVVTVGSAPPAAALVERFVDRTPLSRGWLVGTVIGVAGVAALAVSGSGHDGGDAAAALSGWGSLLGIALGLLAGCAYAVYSWGAARIMRTGVTSRAVMGSVFGVGGLLLMPVLALTGGPILASTGNLGIVAYLALVPMFLGYVLYGRGLATVAASTATTLSLAEPAVATLVAVIVLHERLGASGWLGLALVFASLLVTSVPEGTKDPRHAAAPDLIAPAS